MGLFDFLFGKEKAVTENLRKRNLTTSTKSSTVNHSVNITPNTIDRLIKDCIDLEVKGNVADLQNKLYNLYSLFNKPGSGRLILDYHDKLNLGLCFAFMLQYDWMHDNDIREVWAEDGFYCIQEYLDNQKNGMQGQVEGMIILFTLLCVGRDSLKPKIQNILDKAEIVGNPIFHSDDYKIGAQNIIDQISLVAVSGIRDMGQAAIPVMMQVLQKYNGTKFFENIIHRTDLMKYDIWDVINKIRFIKKVIGSILTDM